MNSSEKLYKIYQDYELKIDVGRNVEEKILITLCAYHFDTKNQFYGNGYSIDAAIDDLYEEIYNKKTAE